MGGTDVKAIRWENIDLKAANLTKEQLRLIVVELKQRLEKEDPLASSRLKKAIKRANSLLNAPKERKKKEAGSHFYSTVDDVGRFGGGRGSATFVSGGAPGSKR
jgi:CRISPR/Cas system CSM-associated protein Csm2 small subunit